MAAHEKRILHRDLKPENLFLTKDGRIKILDFGIAKLMNSEFGSEAVPAGSAATMTTQTKVGSVLGTIAYMSPEQLRGKAVDHRSDIFSFGAILYEMLSGNRAFAGETQVDTMTAILREDPPEMVRDGEHIPVAFEQVVRHCLEKEPENRFQSARDLAFALGTLADVTTSKQIAVLPANRSRSQAAFGPGFPSALLRWWWRPLRSCWERDSSRFPTRNSAALPLSAARCIPLASRPTGGAWSTERHGTGIRCKFIRPFLTRCWRARWG